MRRRQKPEKQKTEFEQKLEKIDQKLKKDYMDGLVDIYEKKWAIWLDKILVDGKLDVFDKRLYKIQFDYLKFCKLSGMSHEEAEKLLRECGLSIWSLDLYSGYTSFVPNKENCEYQIVVHQEYLYEGPTISIYKGKEPVIDREPLVYLPGMWIKYLLLDSVEMHKQLENKNHDTLEESKNSENEIDSLIENMFDTRKDDE